MYGDGEPSETPVEPGANQASTSRSSGEALSKQAHDNPAFVGNATGNTTSSTSGDQPQSSNVRDGEARGNVIPEGSLQNDGAWVPLVFSPVMLPGNPESWNGTPGAIPPGAFTPPHGTTPSGTADGSVLSQWMPVLIPFQIPFFLSSPPSDQAGQNAGFYPVPSMVPFFGPFGMAPGAPNEFKFPVPTNVPIPTEGNPADATAGQQAANAGRAPPVIEREGIRLGQVEQMQPNGLPPVAQAGAGQLPIQGPVIRRFQVGIQLDLLLLLKLAVVVFVFNQDGSKDRLLLLLGLAGVIYLYQTGLLAPLLRWLAVKAQQFMTPPQQLAQGQPDQQPAPGVQAMDAPAADAAVPGAEEPAGEAGAAPGGVNAQAPGGNAQNPQDPFWAFVKELQMLVVGFVTSLLPGFHPHAD
ncbi:uncharacterized protein [Physcomitrium patens]|nr:uncharacterized protein LOC112286567 [Physcomitrium patens]XP_024384311.1 uncharacterized protein LOC112286567 [Physcomitrium patens]XP_024384312.1 uncharacterized protein LOC112286567 [Physcomitrium patens]PNR47972.1 hypothetical protein PHYPA_012445 [Physcomitrium patens]|eukprot:XP_024384310.1 uncharacterized protein LOC112286567 [Physcomitrella patens]